MSVFPGRHPRFAVAAQTLKLLVFSTGAYSAWVDYVQNRVSDH